MSFAFDTDEYSISLAAKLPVMPMLKGLVLRQMRLLLFKGLANWAWSEVTDKILMISKNIRFFMASMVLRVNQ